MEGEYPNEVYSPYKMKDEEEIMFLEKSMLIDKYPFYFYFLKLRFFIYVLYFLTIIFTSSKSLKENNENINSETIKVY